MAQAQLAKEQALRDLENLLLAQCNEPIPLASLQKLTNSITVPTSKTPPSKATPSSTMAPPAPTTTSASIPTTTTTKATSATQTATTRKSPPPRPKTPVLPQLNLPQGFEDGEYDSHSDYEEISDLEDIEPARKRRLSKSTFDFIDSEPENHDETGIRINPHPRYIPMLKYPKLQDPNRLELPLSLKNPYKSILINRSVDSRDKLLSNENVRYSQSNNVTPHIWDNIPHKHFSDTNDCAHSTSFMKPMNPGMIILNPYFPSNVTILRQVKTHPCRHHLDSDSSKSTPPTDALLMLSTALVPQNQHASPHISGSMRHFDLTSNIQTQILHSS